MDDKDVLMYLVRQYYICFVNEAVNEFLCNFNKKNFLPDNDHGSYGPLSDEDKYMVINDKLYIVYCRINKFIDSFCLVLYARDYIDKTYYSFAKSVKYTRIAEELNKSESFKLVPISDIAVRHAITDIHLGMLRPESYLDHILNVHLNGVLDSFKWYDTNIYLTEKDFYTNEY